MNMSQTQKADWFYFIIPATLIWLAGLAITAWDFRQAQRTVWPFAWHHYLGLGLMVAGVAIRRLARWTLGRHFSWRLRTLNGHKLVKAGMYRYIRHPAYTGDLMFQFGIPIFFASLYGLLVMLLLIPCLVNRIVIEEKMLVEQSGPEYLNYRQSTKKLIPYVY